MGNVMERYFDLKTITFWNLSVYANDAYSVVLHHIAEQEKHELMNCSDQPGHFIQSCHDVPKLNARGFILYLQGIIFKRVQNISV